jgi:hypothetical protein
MVQPLGLSSAMARLGLPYNTEPYTDKCYTTPSDSSLARAWYDRVCIDVATLFRPLSAASYGPQAIH